MAALPQTNLHKGLEKRGCLKSLKRRNAAILAAVLMASRRQDTRAFIPVGVAQQRAGRSPDSQRDAGVTLSGQPLFLPEKRLNAIFEVRSNPMNTLYYGVNLNILWRYIKDESVDLVYLDPPFNSNRNYEVLFTAFES